MPATMKDIETIEMMYNAGTSVKDIADEFGWAPSTIYAILEDAGVVMRKDQQKRPIVDFLDEALVKQVTADYAKGVTVAKIKRTSGLSQHTIYRVLEDQGVPLRSSVEEKTRDDERVQRAVKMYKDGAKIIKIEVETGVASTMLYKELYKQGIPLRRDLP